MYVELHAKAHETRLFVKTSTLSAITRGSLRSARQQCFILMRTTVASDTRLLGIGLLTLMKMVAKRRRKGVVKLSKAKDRWKWREREGGRGWTSTTADSGRYTNLISRKWTSRLAGSVHRVHPVRVQRH